MYNNLQIFMKLLNYLSEEEILTNLKSQSQYEQFVRWQIIYSVFKNPGKVCKDISSMLGQPEWKVFRVVENYNKEGTSFSGIKQRGGRRAATSFLSLEEEKLLLANITDKALKGLITAIIYDNLQKG